MIAIVVGVVFLATVFATSWVRSSAIKANRLDIPNQRSSHTRPTPRGAGIAVATSFIGGLCILWMTGQIETKSFLALGLPGLLVAFIGFLDDRGKLNTVRWRLVCHFFAAIVAVWIIGGLPDLALTSSAQNFGVIGDCLAVIYLVWMINLFNFMDGIDTITAIETITSCVPIALILAPLTTLWTVPAILSAAICGFLIFNWPPAKIFLGDMGSGFIGFAVGVISLIIAQDFPLSAVALLIMTGVFTTDTTVTLIQRLFNRDQIYIAHRTHAYQHLAKSQKHHLNVSLGIAAINVAWLFPIAWLVSKQHLTPLTGLAIAYLPLIFLAILLRAGKSTKPLI